MNTPHAVAALQAALAAHRAGDLAAAEAHYRDVLAADPGDADALHLLGTIVAGKGDFERGVALIREALAARPDMPEAHFNLGNILSGGGRFSEAVPHFHRAAELQPANAEAFSNLAGVLLRLKRPAEAEPFASRAVTLDPKSASALRNLASVQFELHDLVTCEATLDRLLALAPSPAPIPEIQRLVKLKLKSGGAAEALAVIARAQAAYPADARLVLLHAGMLPDGEASAILGDAAAAVRTPEKALPFLRELTLRRARANRVAAGLPPDNAISPEDAAGWSDPEGLARYAEAAEAALSNVPSLPALLAAICVAVTRGAWDEAERLLARGRAANGAGFADCAVFDPAFHVRLAGIDVAALTERTLPVQTLRVLPPSDVPALYLGCDELYFQRFALPFIRALDAAGTAVDVQVHILDGSEAAWRPMVAELAGLGRLRVGFSAEASGVRDKGTVQARIYYHAMRFVRLAQEMERSARPWWLLDADVQLTGDPRGLLARLDTQDIALRFSPCALGPAEKILAGCVGFAPSAQARAFARRVAAYILHFKDAGAWRWGIDQAALFAVYAAMTREKPGLSALFLDRATFSLGGEAEGAFHFLTGLDKFLPSRGAAEDSGPGA